MSPRRQLATEPLAIIFSRYAIQFKMMVPSLRRHLRKSADGHHNFPLVLGNLPAMRGSRWHAASVARAKALNSASTM